MAELKTPIQGKDKILMFRLLSKSTESAARLALQTSHEIGKTRETTTTQTKDGAIVTTGGLETVISIEAISTRDEVNEMLESAVDNGETLEVWEIDLKGKPDAEGKLPALYGQGYLNSWTTPDDVEEHETISTEMNISGKLVPGYVTLTPEQEEEIAYAFKDIIASI